MARRIKTRNRFPLPLLAFLLFALAAANGVAQGTAPGDTLVFTTNTGTRYHRESCSSLRNSKIRITLDEAARRGLEPCGICKAPPLPTRFAVADGPSARPAERPARASRGALSSGLYRVNEAGLRTFATADLSRALPAVVSGHVDGDTVKVSIQRPPEGLKEQETIRLLGVDTPETKHPNRQVERFGQEASDFTRQNLLGKQVYLVFDWDLRDRYGRLLAYIYTAQGQCFNARLISEGYGHAYLSFAFQFTEEFRGLEREAREAKRGLWGD